MYKKYGESEQSLYQPESIISNGRLVVSSKRKRSRKAISPVVSNLILITAVIGVGLFLWWFAITRTNIASAVYAEEVGSGIEKIEERILVEHIKFTFDEGEEVYTALDVWVYNYGKIGVTVRQIYLEHDRLLEGSFLVTTIDIGNYEHIIIDLTVDDLEILECLTDLQGLPR